MGPDAIQGGLLPLRENKPPDLVNNPQDALAAFRSDTEGMPDVAGIQPVSQAALRQEIPQVVFEKTIISGEEGATHISSDTGNVFPEAKPTILSVDPWNPQDSQYNAIDTDTGPYYDNRVEDPFAPSHEYDVLVANLMSAKTPKQVAAHANKLSQTIGSFDPHSGNDLEANAKGMLNAFRTHSSGKHNQLNMRAALGLLSRISKKYPGLAEEARNISNQFRASSRSRS